MVPWLLVGPWTAVVDHSRHMASVGLAVVRVVALLVGPSVLLSPAVVRVAWYWVRLLPLARPVVAAQRRLPLTARELEGAMLCTRL